MYVKSWCFLLFSLFISLGVLYSNLLLYLTPGVLIIIFFISSIFLYTYKNKISILITVSIYCFFFGAWRVHENSDQFKTEYFINAIEKKNTIRAKLTDKLKMGKTLYYVFKIDSLNNKSCKGQLINKCKKFNNTLKIGEIIYIKDVDSDLIFSLLKISPDLYNYWSGKNVHHELKGCYDFKIIKSELSTINNIKLTGKQKTKEWLLSAVSENNANLLYGFITGQKQYIHKDIKQDLAISGVYHILAVSGLHIGIIFLILQKIYSLILRLKIWNPINIFLSVIGVWGFCCWTDFSPSAIRASIMITLICSGKIILKDLFCHKNIIQIFFVCLFFNLIYDPSQLFNISFQFSYLAYGGILVYYKRLNELNPIKKNMALSKIWSLSSLSLSAQCAILPLSLLYFKYFSTYFILGNLLITPVIPLVYILCLLSILSPFEFFSLISNTALE